MFYTNTYDHIFQQAGAAIKTSFSDYFLRKGLLSRDGDTYQPTRSHQASKGIKISLVNYFANLIGKFGQPYNHFLQIVR